MISGGSTGTPSFKQIVMHKKKAMEGLKMTGSGESRDSGSTRNGSTINDKEQKMTVETRGGSKKKEKANSEKKDSTLGTKTNQRAAGSMNPQTGEEEEQEKKGKKERKTIKNHRPLLAPTSSLRSLKTKEK